MLMSIPSLWSWGYLLYLPLHELHHPLGKAHGLLSLLGIIEVPRGYVAGQAVGIACLDGVLIEFFCPLDLPKIPVQGPHLLQQVFEGMGSEDILPGSQRQIEVRLEGLLRCLLEVKQGQVESAA